MPVPKNKTEHPRPKSTKDAPLIPEVQRNINEKEKDNSGDDEVDDPTLDNIYHDDPNLIERPISDVYPVIDTDLARDNVENDLSDADFQDLCD